MTQFHPSRLPSDETLKALLAPRPQAQPSVPKTPEGEPTHLLHFEPLSAQSAGLDIPCDPQGRVGLDALGDKLRNDYFFARALIGRLFARPTVMRA